MAGVAGSQPQNLDPQVEQPQAPQVAPMPSVQAQAAPSPEPTGSPAPTAATGPDPLDQLADQHTSAGPDPLDQLADEHADVSKHDRNWDAPGMTAAPITQQQITGTFPGIGMAAGGVLGGPPGAVGGALIGKAVQNIADESAGLQKPQGVVDALKGYAATGVETALWEAGAWGAAKLAGTALDTAKAMFPATTEKVSATLVGLAQKLQEQAERSGIFISPHEALPNVPKLATMGKEAAASPAMQQAVINRAEVAQAAVQQIGQSFNGTPGNGVATTIAQGKAADRAFGQLLGNYRTKAIEAAEAPMSELYPTPAIPTQQTFLSPLPQTAPGMGGNPKIYGPRNDALLLSAQTGALSDMTKGEIASLGQQGEWLPGKSGTINMTGASQALDDARQSLGFNGMKKPTTSFVSDELAGRLNTTPANAHYLVNEVQRLTDILGNSETKLAPRQADALYTRFKQATDNHWPSNGMDSPGAVPITLMKIKDGLRDDFTNGIATFLGPEDKAAYTQAMGRYSTIKQAASGLDKLFSTETPTTAAVVDYMRKGGLGSIDRLNDMKTVITAENPANWDTIAKSYWDRFMTDHADRSIAGQRMGGVNWDKLEGTLGNGKQPAEQLQAIIGPERFQALSDLASPMAAAQRVDREFVDGRGGVIKLAKGIVKTAVHSSDIAATALASNESAIQLLDGQKSQALIKRMSSDQQSTVGQVLEKARAILTDKTMRTSMQGVGAAALATQNQPQQ